MFSLQDTYIKLFGEKEAFRSLCTAFYLNKVLLMLYLNLTTPKREGNVINLPFDHKGLVIFIVRYRGGVKFLKQKKIFVHNEN